VTITTQPQPMTCKCGYIFLGGILTNVAVNICAAHMQTLHCPECGANYKSLSFGGVLPVAPEAIAAARWAPTDAERLSVWLNMHDHGASSRCIADVMCGHPSTGCYPHGPDNFGRCHRLLQLYPEWRARLGEMAAVNNGWAALVARWDEIAAAYELDLTKASVDRLCWGLMRDTLLKVGA
jgi:hypothetical protein